MREWTEGSRVVPVDDLLPADLLAGSPGPVRTLMGRWVPGGPIAPVQRLLAGCPEGKPAACLVT